MTVGRWILHTVAHSSLVLGGNAAPTAKDAATGADVIITMLPSSPHVVDLYTNPKTGLLPFLK